MTALRERLRGALAQPVRRERPAEERSVTGLADLSVLGGRWFQGEYGPGYVVESVYEGGYVHGDIPLHRALSADFGTIARQVRDERVAVSRPERMLFLDTETTGMGGAGSMVFLCGIAKFDGASVRLRQYLLPSPAYECGLMGGIAEELADADGLVSYNGKSFDVPALEARAVLSRTPISLRTLPHVDLLHPNRRLFKGMFDSHRLADVEQRLLGFTRENDCPGSEAPERYFAFQRTGDPTHIAPVLRHNAWDVLSLVTLTAHLAAACDGASGTLQSARAAEYAGDWELAAVRYRDAVESAGGRGARLEALERLARCEGRAGNWGAAAVTWRRLIAEPRNRKLTPFIELAKIEEHRLKDVDAALKTTSAAMELVRRGLVRPGRAGSETSAKALAHRIGRLETRSARLATRMGSTRSRA